MQSGFCAAEPRTIVVAKRAKLACDPNSREGTPASLHSQLQHYSFSGVNL